MWLRRLEWVWMLVLIPGLVSAVHLGLAFSAASFGVVFGVLCQRRVSDPLDRKIDANLDETNKRLDRIEAARKRDRDEGDEWKNA
jgi:hypothetical protein